MARSKDLRQRFARDPDKWDAFRPHYHTEIDTRPATLKQLRELIRGGNVITLLFAARETKRNNTFALAGYLRSRALA